MPANQRIVALLITLTTFHFTTSAQYSQWIYPGSNGKLVYKPLAKGDKIMDFSYAGYMGGGISLPAVPVVASISALPGDNSDFIQHTIDSIAQLPLNKGFRGAVLLQPGIYNCEKTITINASGIVLRGSGSQENGTVVNMTGKPHPCINIKGNISYAVGKTSAIITDAYVPSGSLSFTVNNAAAFKTGDVIRLTRKVTDEWVQFMGMDQLVRDGKKQTWVNGEFVTDRTISAITGNTITVDVPLTDAIDAQYAGAGVTVSTVGVKDELLQSGIENLRIVSPSQSVTISEGHNQGIVVKGAADGY